MAFTPTEMHKPTSPADPTEALAQQRVAQVLAEVHTMLARITDSSMREELSRAAGSIEMQLRAGIRPDQVQGVLMQVEQLRGAASEKVHTETQRSSSHAVMNGVLLSAAAEERIRIRSQQINASNIREFVGTFFDPSEGLDPEMQARITENVSKILLDSPELAQWNDLPQTTRDAATRATEEARARLQDMQSDPRYAQYQRVLARMARNDMVNTPEELAFINAIAEGTVSPEEANAQFRAQRDDKADRAGRRSAAIAGMLEPAQLSTLQEIGLARGNQLDMREIFSRYNEYPENWGDRFRQYRGTDPSSWPAEIRQEHAVREAARTAIAASAVRDVLGLGQMIERNQGKSLGAAGEEGLAHLQDLYAVMLDSSAALADRRAAVEGYLTSKNDAFKDASAYVRSDTVSKVLASMDANRHIYTSNDYERGVVNQFALSVSNYERNVLTAYMEKEGATVSEDVLQKTRDIVKSIDAIRSKYAGAMPAPRPAGTPAAPTPAPEVEVMDAVAPMQIQTLTPMTPVLAQPVVPAAEMGPADPRAEGSQGRWDNLYKNAMENRLEKAFEGHDMAQIVAVLGPLLNEHNVGRQDYISIHEAENALAAIGVTANHLSAALTLNDVAAALTPNAAPRPAPETGRNT